MKYRYAKKEDIPAELVQLYKEDNGSYVLQVEGAVESSRLDEFRSTNIELKRKLEAFAGVDPEELKRQRQEAERQRQEAMKKEGKIDELIATQLTPYKQQIEELNKRLSETAQQHNNLLMRTEVLSLAPKHKVRASAIEDLTTRAARVFSFADGKLIAKDPATGQPLLSAKNPGQPLTPDEWFTNLNAQAPHLFETSTGGGAAGSSGGAGSGIKNPWSKNDRNLSEQIRIEKTNPALAAQLKSSAS